MAVHGLSLHQEILGSRKTLEQKIILKSALFILAVSKNTFHSTNLFCCFTSHHAPTNSVALSFCVKTTHNPQFLDPPRRRANARNVSFRTSPYLENIGPTMGGSDWLILVTATSAFPELKIFFFQSPAALTGGINENSKGLSFLRPGSQCTGEI